MNTSLGDYILDRTESLTDELILEYFIDRNDDKIGRLLDAEQYLLEGSRGVGKTMLMKAAKLKSLKEFGKNSVLPIWVSFEESIRIERINLKQNSIDPFLQWTMGKILHETLITLTTHKPLCIDSLNSSLSKIFGIQKQDNYENYIELLGEYIKILEKGDIIDSEQVQKEAPSNELSEILDNPTSFRDFLLTLINDFNLTRIVFLFDEAAHVFSHEQQEKFFTFFKSLRHPQIACKAAVYPGITNYGKYFERGQDAKELRIDWSPFEREDTDYVKKILKKRIQKFDTGHWSKLTSNEDIINIICICSNGNPRFAFHIIDELEESKAFNGKSIKFQTAINCIRKVFTIKWREFSTLKQRLTKYEKYIQEAELLIKNIIIPNLKIWNDKQRKDNKKLSSGCYINTQVYDKISQIFSILAYSNIVSIDYSKKSLGHHNYGYYVSLNPSLLFTDAILVSVEETRKVSNNKDLNQAYSEESKGFKELIETLRITREFKCTNNKCDYKTSEDTFKFCPKCGSKIGIKESESLYKILRSHDISSLKLSDKMIKRLKEKFNNIGVIYDAEDSEIKMKYIKDIRVTKIKTAVMEYMAG